MSIGTQEQEQKQQKPESSNNFNSRPSNITTDRLFLSRSTRHGNAT